MKTIVVKFGGTSLASAAQMHKVADIIHSDPARRYVVASAPGKRDSSDTKVTDLLYKCYDLAAAKEDFSGVLKQIENRFRDIITELPVEFDLDNELTVIRKHLETNPQRDYMASRGEYLNSKILAAYLGFTFIDPADYIRFFEDGTHNAEASDVLLGNALSDLDYAVVAGFYGALPDGTVHTFSRGGSDVTGAIVARATHADLYENWTDVSGMLGADPRIVKDPHPIDYISYSELRELSYMGASVLHEDATFPVRKAGIPINIRNTNRPEDAGTMISPTLPKNRAPKTVTGVSGRKGFSAIQIEKSMMNSEIGFFARLLNIFAAHHISIEHFPSGIDTMSLVVSTAALAPQKEQILQEIRQSVHPDILLVEDNIALVAVVGQGMAYSRGIAARVFSALADADINIRMIDQGSSELNIIIGIEEKDYENAIRALYEAVLR